MILNIKKSNNNKQSSRASLHHVVTLGEVRSFLFNANAQAASEATLGKN